MMNIVFFLVTIASIEVVAAAGNITTLGATCVPGTDTCTVAHSACTNTSGSLQCSCDPPTTYYQVNTTACAATLGSNCTTGPNGDTMCKTRRKLANSQCSSAGKCACKSGFTASNNLCVTESGSRRILGTIWTLCFLVLVALFMRN